MPRISRIKQVDWDQYRKIINDFIAEDAGKQPFLWLKKLNMLSAFGEDHQPAFTPIKLEGLFHYNYVKTWPSNRVSVSGELENVNLVLYISAKSLEEAGYLNQFGYWDFNWAEDRFILNGKVYKPGGDTQVAQAKDKALLFFVILQREDPEEAEKIIETFSSHILEKTGVDFMTIGLDFTVF